MHCINMVWFTVFGSDSEESANASRSIPGDTIPFPNPGMNQLKRKDMNKKDLIPIILLVLMIPLWLLIDRAFIAPRFASESAPAAQTPGIDTALESPAAEPVIEASPEAGSVAVDIEEPAAEETVAVISNGKVELQLTSLGGGIKSATMLDYPEFNEEGSDPVVLSFTHAPALSYEGLDGLGVRNPLNLAVAADGKSATFTRKLQGCVFERTMVMGDGYVLTVRDRFTPSAEEACTLPGFRILTGRMRNPDDMKAMKGLSILGVDSYTPEVGIRYWGRRLNKLYKNLDRPEELDTVPEEMRDTIVDWISAKNMFFTQILGLEEPIATMAVLSSRDTAQKGVIPHDVAAALVFRAATIPAGDALQLDYTYYVGPKQYDTLKAAGINMEGVMEFETIGFWSFLNWMMEPARIGLLWTLNKLDGIFHNYGIAIILLTLLVRTIFWPLTHKSTEKMRENSEKMQLVQPKIKALQEKYKNNPKKLQAETMKVYQEHGFNPMGMMGGCLPMILQMPVLFALYSVIRNAIELRYSGFLWIADLSAPENLLMGKVPIVGALNILPIVMAASMVWQQKLSSPTTAAATPEQQQQQKMMMVMMPLMMLFFFYTMPSGLVLYFSVSNLSMIAQTLMRNLRKKMKEA
jgi:YidC/Oxa1 family membrane protein insertase